MVNVCEDVKDEVHAVFFYPCNTCPYEILSLYSVIKLERQKAMRMSTNRYDVVKVAKFASQLRFIRGPNNIQNQGWVKRQTHPFKISNGARF